MGDHFVLLVDRLLTEATLEAAIESRNRMMQATASSPADDDDDAKVEKTYHKVDLGDITTPGKLVECRICQDEDVDSNMETPCSCCGSLKYAHRKCIQRWCNEKGNTICEICQQQFKPGYTAPPPLFQLGRIPVNFRGNWESSRRDIHGPRIIAVVSTGQDYTNSVSDEYSASTARNVIYCRLVAIIFMTLLLLRHTLPLILSGDVDISFPLFVLLFARVAGIVLPIYVMARALTAFQHRRRSHHYHQEPPNSSIPPSDEEAGTRIPHPEA